MKKIFLGLVFVLFAFQVNAATMSWDEDASTGAHLAYNGFKNDGDNSSIEIVASGGFSGSYLGTVEFVFDIDEAMTVGSEAFEIKNSQVDVTTITLDNIAGSFTKVEDGTVAYWKLIPALQLSAGSHTIRVAVADASTGGQVDIKVSSVPVPAAVWLFGSALMGLVGVSRRKSTAVTA